MGALRPAVLCLLLATSGGCVATFASLPETPAPPAEGLALRVTTTGESYLEYAPGDWREWGSAHDRRAVDALEGTGWFTAVGPEVEPYDVRAEITVRQHQGYTYGGFLNLITAFLVPVKRTHRVEVEARVVSASGAEAQCHAEDQYAVWQQLLLVPVYPFAAPAQHKARLVDQLTLRCLSHALGELGRA